MLVAILPDGEQILGERTNLFNQPPRIDRLPFQIQKPVWKNDIIALIAIMFACSRIRFNVMIDYSGVLDR